MDIYLTQENYKSLCEFFDINYQPIEDLHPNLTHFQNYIVFDRTGIPHTKETKEKISKTKKLDTSLLGNKHAVGNKSRTGQKQSGETKLKISQTKTGKKRPPCSEESRKKMSESRKKYLANLKK